MERHTGRINPRVIVEGNALASAITYKDPSARFALTGSIDGVPQAWPISEDMLSRHMLFLGGIGTGKTNALYQLIQRLRTTITPQDIIVIFDTKGDYYNEFYRAGDVVISNDSRATGSSGVDYWNLFNEVSIDDRVVENVVEVCDTIFADQLKRTTQPFFPNAARDLLMALILHMLRSDTCKDKRDNHNLRAMLDGFGIEPMKRILSIHTDLAALVSYIDDPRSGQTLGVVSELQQAARRILVGSFAKRGTLSMRQLVRRKGGRIVFVEYDLGIGGMLTPIYRLLMDLAIKESLCCSSNEGSVYFILDEFRLLPKLTHVDDGVNFGRSLGAKFVFGVQNVEQVYHAYGEEIGRSILSALSAKICFRVTDGATRTYIKEIFGQNVTKAVYMSSVPNRGVQEMLRDTSVVEDWDVTRLGLGDAIIGYDEHPPFRFHFQRYGKR